MRRTAPRAQRMAGSRPAQVSRKASAKRDAARLKSTAIYKSYLKWGKNMEHEILLVIGMVAAFILGARLKDMHLPHIHRKKAQPDEAQKQEDIIAAQMRALMSYTERDYKKREN